MTVKQITAVQKAAGYAEKAMQVLHEAICEKSYSTNQNCTACPIYIKLVKNRTIDNCAWADLNCAGLNFAEILSAINRGKL